jgi:hypothetical protein
MTQRISIAMVAVLSIGLSHPSSAFGEHYSHWWDHPCNSPPDYGLVCNEGGGESFGPGLGQCWCQAQWSDADNWTGTGYPDDTDDNPRIQHSNTGHCDGGTNDGDPCSESGDCPSGTCDNIETQLLIQFTENLTTHPLHIDTLSSAASTDSLNVKFFSRTCAGGSNAGLACEQDLECSMSTCQSASYALTLEALYIDATDGAIVLTIGGSTTVSTE